MLFKSITAPVVILAISISQGASASDLSRSPTLRNPQTVITGADYPRSSARRNEIGIVSVVLRVTPEGRVDQCSITETSGYDTLDATTCSLLESRARFGPALDSGGTPVAGEYRVASTWGVDARQPSTNIALPLQVAELPPSYKSPLRARLVFDATGHVSACEVTATSGSEAADRAACAYASQHIVIPAPKAALSEIMPAAVRYLTASLSVEKSSLP